METPQDYSEMFRRRVRAAVPTAELREAATRSLVTQGPDSLIVHARKLHRSGKWNIYEIVKALQEVQLELAATALEVW